MAETTGCASCKVMLYCVPENTCLFVFTRQPWLSYVEVICKGCATKNRVFFGPKQWQRSIQNFADYPTITEDFAEERVAKRYGEVYSLETLEEHELTEREERLVEFFHWLLENKGVE